MVVRWFAPATTLLLGLVTANARAADATLIRLEYSAGPECPDRGAFVEEVLRRSPNARLAGDGEPAPEFRVVVTRSDRGSNAELTVLDGDAPALVRELAAPECAELVASMAVVIALAIDSRVSSPSPTEPASPEAAATPQDPRADESRRERERAPPAPVYTSDRLPSAEASDGSETTRNDLGARLPARGYGWVLGAAGSLVSDIAPEWSPGALVFSDLGLAGDLRTRLSLAYATSGTLAFDDARARFSLLTGRAEICPVALQLARALVLRPCGGIELGAHRAAGEASARIEEPKSSSALWLLGLLALRAEIGVTRFLVVELETQARVPFLHRTYVFERPDEVAYETPGIGFGLQLGAGFPLLQ